MVVHYVMCNGWPIWSPMMARWAHCDWPHVPVIMVGSAGPLWRLALMTHPLCLTYRGDYLWAHYNGWLVENLNMDIKVSPKVA